MCSPALPNSNTHTNRTSRTCTSQTERKQLHTHFPSTSRVDRRVSKNDGRRWSRGNKHHALHAVSSTISTRARERECFTHTDTQVQLSCRFKATPTIRTAENTKFTRLIPSTCFSALGRSSVHRLDLIVRTNCVSDVGSAAYSAPARYRGTLVTEFGYYA